jgi:hypothetical protein
MNGRNSSGGGGYGRDYMARGYDAPMQRPRGYDTPMRGYPGWRYDAGLRGSSRGYDAGFGNRGAGRYGRDYWWLGERAMPQARYGSDYDRGYRTFDQQNHPRFSPVGGMYPHVGGGYSPGSMPRPIREGAWFSDWTRWF